MVTTAPAARAPEDPLDILGRVIRAERDGLARLARREGLRPEDAVDCVQDALCTFLQMTQRGDLPAEPRAIPPLLAGIVRNAARNRRRLHHVAKPHQPLETERASEAPTSEALIARAEDHVRLRACVDRLCDTQKAVVTLRLLEERHGDDVATSLGISRGYVDVLLHRAKLALRACLVEEGVSAAP